MATNCTLQCFHQNTLQEQLPSQCAESNLFRPFATALKNSDDDDNDKEVYILVYLLRNMSLAVQKIIKESSNIN